MDKSWIQLADRRLPEYQDGVKKFLDFAYYSKQVSDKIRCPCKKCNNVYLQNRDDVEADLLEYGILESYVTWMLHGEKIDDSSSEELCFDQPEDDDECELNDVAGIEKQCNEDDQDDMQSLLEEYYAASRTNTWAGDDSPNREEYAVPQSESDKFMRLLRDVDKELYPGCESFTKLSFVVTLMHLKVLNKWSNKSFSMLLEVLKKALPNGETLPCSYYEAKRVVQDLGLDYQKIDACVNDCVLYRKEHETRENCPKCSAPRYKHNEVKTDKNGEKRHKKIPQKILRYFPLKPRLQKLFISKKIAQDMRWHKEKRVSDEVLRHPADAQEWKDFDKSEHKEELERNGCRNVEKEHETSFTEWFEKRIELAFGEGVLHINEDLRHLAYGPDKRVTHYEACIVNGLRFHTRKHEIIRRTQNSGVVVKVEDQSGFVDYYGVLTEIIQLDFLGNHQVVVFKCDWFEGRSVQRDKFNCTSINTAKPWKTNEPFVLASQARQVFYVDDNKLGKDWKVVIEAQTRSSWNVLEKQDDNIIFEEPLLENESHNTSDLFNCPSDSVEWHRTDIPSATATIETNMGPPSVDNSSTFIDDDDNEVEDCTLAEYGEDSECHTSSDDEDDYDI